MNFIAILILSAILLEFSLHIAADILNLKVLKNHIPEVFQGIYEPENYKKSQRYLRVNTAFGWVASGFSLIIVLLFWFLNGFSLLDLYIRSFDLNPVINGLFFIGILVAVKGIISIPFNYYSTFIIEEEFGFNKTTKKTFFMDLIKGLILGTAIGIPLLAGILIFFQYTGQYAWIYCWIATTLFSISIQYLYPVWIMPIFNKFEPLDEGDLRKAIFNYAESINFSLKNIYVMDGSKRSSKSNAFFTGFGKNKRIVLFDTLINEHTTGELLSVLAHEMGHFKKNHIKKMMVLSFLNMGLVFYLLSIFISNRGLFDAFYMDYISVYAGLIFFGLLYTPLGFFTGLIMQAYSRMNEFEADKYALETTGDGKSLVDALKKLSVNNLSNLYPHPTYVLLNYSHPPVLNRIKSISKSA